HSKRARFVDVDRCLSHPHGLEDDALGSLSIPFAIENALPGTEVEAPFGDGHDDFMAYCQRAQMCGGVVFAGAGVMPISLRIPWRDRVLEPLQNVLPKIRLMVIHENRRGDVHGGNEHHSVIDVGGGATLVDGVGDVDDLVSLFGVEGEIVCVGLHWCVDADSGWMAFGTACKFPHETTIVPHA